MSGTFLREVNRAVLLGLVTFCDHSHAKEFMDDVISLFDAFHLANDSLALILVILAMIVDDIICFFLLGESDAKEIGW